MLKNGVLGRAAVGAWIEISFRETQKKLAKVAPPVGAWIEICRYQHWKSILECRSPRGSVD